MNLVDLLAPLDGMLRRRRIRYAVIGAHAVAAWGEVRATRDIDLLCETGDLGALTEALTEEQLRFERRTGDLDDPISEVVRIEVAAEGGPHEVEVLAGIRGAPRGIVERARQVALEGLLVPVASPEDTIVLKLLAGSPRDVADAQGIMRLQRDRLDLALLRDICPPSLGPTLETLLSE